MPRLRAAVLLAWGICTLVLVTSIIDLVRVISAAGPNASPLNLASKGAEELIALMFAIPGALIISRLPRNVIGWLLLGPTVVFSLSTWTSAYLDQFTTPPPATLFNLLVTWFNGATWLALIFPLILIPLLFPTGQPPTPRWRWPIYLAVGMCLFFIVWSGTTRVIQYDSDLTSWSMINPIGILLPNSESIIMPFWSVLLAVLTAASLASTVVRYRHASVVEKEQMKWLLYGCAIFALVYIPLVIQGGDELRGSQVINNLLNMLFLTSMMLIPIAIAIAILRYRVFDIDVIIRLTLVYALVTGLLGLVYAGGVVLLQAGFRAVTGETSSVAVVITTLIIAVLFNPLRQRIQAIIDRRFFRQKYDAEQALAEFALAARSGTDLDALTEMMVDIVQKTLQPTQASLQLSQRVRENAETRKRELHE